MTKKSTRLAVVGAVFASVLCAAQADDVSELDFKFEYRLRVENLDNAYRAGAAGSDQYLASRLLTGVDIKAGPWLGELELQDARVWFDDNGTPLGGDDVNTLEPLQAWLGWRSGDEKTKVKVGRQTLDLGGRRLMARQRYRNTINAFDGIYLSHQHESYNLQALYFNPVEQRPNDRASLDDNEFDLDESNDTDLWGLYLTIEGATQLDLYYFGLEDDSVGLDIGTYGARAFRRKQAGQWYYDAEFALQTGDFAGLDVHATFLQSYVGYGLGDSWKSGIELLVDWITGDDNPNDLDFERFNALFGATRFDLGVTGIYGALARRNIKSPAVRWSFKPADTQNAFLAYRAAWLDAARDGQARSGLRDVTGASGDFLGHQLEGRWRVWVMPEVEVDLGFVYLIKGEFFEDAPNVFNRSDSLFSYFGVTYFLR